MKIDFSNSIKKHRHFITCLCFILIAFLINEPTSVLINDFENRSWDLRQKFFEKQTQKNDKIKIIVIDQRSLDFLESEYGLSWPIPREMYKYVLNFLSSGQAKGVAFDILFTESSTQNHTGDLEFAEANNQKLKIVHALTLDTYDKFINKDKKTVLLEKLHANSETINKHFVFNTNNTEYKSATLPYIELLSSKASIGSVQEFPDDDGIFRRHKPFNKFDNSIIPSLPFELYLKSVDDNQVFDLRKFQDKDGNLIVKLEGGNNSFEKFSFASILQSQAQINDQKTPDIDPNIFKDSWVFIGTTAPGLLDFRPTSIEEKGEGVIYLASIFNNILKKSFIIKTKNRESLLILSCFILLSTLLLRTSTKLSIQIPIQFLILISFLCYTILLSSYGIWSPLILPSVMLISLILTNLILDYQIEGREHRFIKHAFQHYVSPTLVNKIANNPSVLGLGGEKREVSIFFSDIEGFTKASEKMDPNKLVSLINEYLNLLTTIILEHKGTLDKYVGDAIVAFWNAPIDTANHADLALKSAIECQKVLEKQKDYFVNKYGFLPATRIGIHTDTVTVGNFGSKDRFDYTIIGDGANLASRLEGSNKAFGTYILFSEETRVRLKDNYLYRFIANLQVKGKDKFIKVYEPSANSIKDENLFSKFNEAFESDDLVACLKQLEDDNVSKAYLKKIENSGIIEITNWVLHDK